MERDVEAVRDVTMLHISDTQFGTHHRFGEGGQSLADTLVVDLERLLGQDIAGVDLIVFSGDVTERGLRSEFDQARMFLDRVCAATGLDYDRCAGSRARCGNSAAVSSTMVIPRDRQQMITELEPEPLSLGCCVFLNSHLL